MFRRPEALLSEAPLLLGLDGAKMSKSRGDTIEIRMSADQTAKLIKKPRLTRSAPLLTIPPSAPRFLTC